MFVSKNWLLNNQDFPPGLYDINFDKASVRYLMHKNLSKSFSNNPLKNKSYKRHLLIENINPFFTRGSYIISKDVIYKLLDLTNELLVINTVKKIYR